jgi:antitoxin Phd
VSNYWQIQQAKAQFSRLIDRALRHGPQYVTKHGRPAVVVLSASDYKQAEKPRESLVEFFRRSPLHGIQLDLQRLKDKDRPVRL